MSEISLTVNGTKRTANVDDDMPLVWVLRDTLALTGTKFGCGMGVCGSCTILEKGKAIRSCQISASQAKGRDFVTIEGLVQGCEPSLSKGVARGRRDRNAGSASRE